MALDRSIAQRAVVDQRLVSYRAELAQFNELPNSLLLLKKERETFAAFMGTCRGRTNWADPPEPRGITKADPDAVTLACIEGWKVQREGENQSWWTTLAEQVSPGILLLFLLATLGGLYRYNLRLAGFHHARTDALGLMAFERDLLKEPIGKDELSQFVQMAEALAADKVEFGKVNTPADQAVEMFKAFMARTKG